MCVIAMHNVRIYFEDLKTIEYDVEAKCEIIWQLKNVKLHNISLHFNEASLF